MTPEQRQQVRQALMDAQGEFEELISWAAIEKAPLRKQEVGSIKGKRDGIVKALAILDSAMTPHEAGKRYGDFAEQMQEAQPEACECRKALCKAQTMMARLFAQVQAFRLVTRCEKTEWQRDFDEEVDTLAGYVSAALASPCSCVGPRDHLEAVQLESRLLQRTIDSMAAEEAAQKEVNALYRRERDSLRAELAIAKQNALTILDMKNAADVQAAELEAELAAANSRAEELAGALEKTLRSAVPNKRDHPTMCAAWESAEVALSAYRATKEKGR